MNIWLVYMLVMMIPLIMIMVSSFLMFWFLLELMSILFLILIIFKDKNKFVVLFTYLFVQSISSTMLIIVMIFNKVILIDCQLLMNIMLFLFNLSLIMKMNLFPFYLWGKFISNNMCWLNFYIFITFQKIPAFFLLYYWVVKSLIWISICVSVLVSVYEGMKQMMMKLIILFSSINHTSWMCIIIILDINWWLIYFLSYSVINLILFYYLELMGVFHVSSLNGFYLNDSVFVKMIICMLLMAIGGLPPFMGFMMKYLLMVMYSYNNWCEIMFFFIIIPALISLYYYLRIVFPLFFLNSNMLKYMIFYMGVDDKYIYFFLFSLLLLFSFIFYNLSILL